STIITSLLSRSRAHLALHSFPTRRSSDLNRGTTFSREPDLTFTASVKAEGLRKSRKEMLARFLGDVTGDGVRELLLRDMPERLRDRKSTRLNSSHVAISYAVFCLKKKRYQ